MNEKWMKWTKMNENQWKMNEKLDVKLDEN